MPLSYFFYPPSYNLPVTDRSPSGNNQWTSFWVKANPQDSTLPFQRPPLWPPIFLKRFYHSCPSILTKKSPLESASTPPPLLPTNRPPAKSNTTSPTLLSWTHEQPIKLRNNRHTPTRKQTPAHQMVHRFALLPTSSLWRWFTENGYELCRC